MAAIAFALLEALAGKKVDLGKTLQQVSRAPETPAVELSRRAAKRKLETRPVQREPEQKVENEGPPKVWQSPPRHPDGYPSGCTCSICTRIIAANRPHHERLAEAERREEAHERAAKEIARGCGAPLQRARGLER